MKTTGAELKAFWKDESVWPGDSYVDGVYLKINGADGSSEDVEGMKDDDKIDLVDGYFCDQSDEGESLLTVFRRWRKKQATEMLLVEIPKGKLEELKTALKAIGGKVL